MILENNMVAGSERVGISFYGDLCPGQSANTGFNHSIKNNTVYSTHTGLYTYYTFDGRNPSSCVLIRNFTIYKSFSWGIYYQNDLSLITDSNTFVDNQVSLFSMIIYPSPLTHQLSNKFDIVRNSLFVGESSAFNCSSDLVSNSSLNYKYSSTSRPFSAGPSGRSKIALTWSNFLGGSTSSW